MTIINALVPVYEPIESEDGMKSRFRFQADDVFFCMAVNHLFETRPESFGSPSMRANLIAETEAFLDQYESEETKGLAPILPFLSGLFKRHGVNPFSDIRLAFLGGEIYNQKICDMFAHFLDLQPTRTEGLRLSNVDHFMAQGKYDYVISGNVVNDPGVKQPDDVFAASASMLKTDGVAIHGISYGDHNYRVILDSDLHTICAQHMIHQINSHKNAFNEQVMDAVVLQQLMEVRVTPAQLNRITPPSVFKPYAPV